MARHGSDFIPYTFQLPTAVAIAKVAADFRLLDLVVLDEPKFRPHVITELFWRGWDHYRRPTLVSFNGRSFDIPLLELAAFRYGINLPGWFLPRGKSHEQPRNRYNIASHLDLLEPLTNFGSTRFVGGLNLAANLLGKPGKMDVQGHMVQDLFNAGKLAEISDYCRCDVLDTYFVFLRSRVLVGEMTLSDEQKLIASTKNWLEEQAKEAPDIGSILTAGAIGRIRGWASNRIRRSTRAISETIADRAARIASRSTAFANPQLRLAAIRFAEAIPPGQRRAPPAPSAILESLFQNRRVATQHF